MLAQLIQPKQQLHYLSASVVNAEADAAVRMCATDVQHGALCSLCNCRVIAIRQLIYPTCKMINSIYC